MLLGGYVQLNRAGEGKSMRGRHTNLLKVGSGGAGGRGGGWGHCTAGTGRRSCRRAQHVCIARRAHQQGTPAKKESTRCPLRPAKQHRHSLLSMPSHCD